MKKCVLECWFRTNLEQIQSLNQDDTCMSEDDPEEWQIIIASLKSCQMLSILEKKTKEWAQLHWQRDWADHVSTERLEIIFTVWRDTEYQCIRDGHDRTRSVNVTDTLKNSSKSWRRIVGSKVSKTCQYERGWVPAHVVYLKVYESEVQTKNLLREQRRC